MLPTPAKIISYLVTHAHAQMRKNVCHWDSAGSRGADGLIPVTETTFASDCTGPNPPLGA